MYSVAAHFTQMNYSIASAMLHHYRSLAGHSLQLHEDTTDVINRVGGEKKKENV